MDGFIIILKKRPALAGLFNRRKIKTSEKKRKRKIKTSENNG